MSRRLCGAYKVIARGALPRKITMQGKAQSEPLGAATE